MPVNQLLYLPIQHEPGHFLKHPTGGPRPKGLESDGKLKFKTTVSTSVADFQITVRKTLYAHRGRVKLPTGIQEVSIRGGDRASLNDSWSKTHAKGAL